MGKNLYSEPKKRYDFTLTQTAIDWLTLQMIELKATSRSDVIEKLARQKPTQNEEACTDMCRY